MLQVRCPCSFVFVVFLVVAACSTTYGDLPEGEPRAYGTRVADETPPYRIQPGDGLQILFAHHPARRAELVVRPDGKLSMPFAEEVHVAGLTVAEADALLTQKVSTQLRDAELTVVVAAIARSQVFVGGEVARAGAVPLVPGMTLFQALTMVGGIAPTGAADSVILVRANGPGQRLVRRVSVLGADMLSNDVTLSPFDILFVPTTSVADVAQFVNSHVNAIVPRAISFTAFYDLANNPFK